MTEILIHRCRVCSGPCLAWAGTLHGWTCRKCLRDYVDAQFDAAARQRLARRETARMYAVGRRGAGSGPAAATTDTRKGTP